MEEILANLMVSDNDAIKQGTSELKDILRKPESTPQLCQLIVTSKSSEIRQCAAILLRKRYTKGKHWWNLPENIRTEVKQLLLQALVNEPEKFVKNSIAQLIGSIVKNELSRNGWPEIFQFIQQLVGSENMADKEMGMYTLSVMTEIAPEAYIDHAQSIIVLLQQTLSSLQNFGNPVTYYLIKVLLHLVPLNKTPPANQIMVNAYHELMPQVLNIIEALISVNENYAVESFELLDELCEQASTVIDPHIKLLVTASLSVANNTNHGSNLRAKGVMLVGWLVRNKKKALMKHKLIEPIIDTLFLLMCLKSDEDNDEVYFENENEDNSPSTCATQTLDLLALNLPPEKIIPYLLRHVEPGLQGTDIYQKKASYLSLAVLAEGCSEYIRLKFLKSFLQCICQGIADNEIIVRNAALFALGQFSEHLQPEISQYSSELLPVLFEYLAQVCEHIKREKKEPPSVDKMFYALEMFCENLNEALLPYLPTLMERLFEALCEGSPIHVQELTLSAIGAAANASKENMLPYFEKIIAILNKYLTDEHVEETMCLQVQAVDTLGTIARTIGVKNFAPLATNSLELGIRLLKDTEDPDLRKSIYGLAASISSVMQKDMAVFLPQIIEPIINSIQSSEGVVPHYKDENSAFPIYEDLSDEERGGPDEEDIEHTDNENDDDDSVAGYSVENSYIEEKEEAILALKEIAQYTGEAFFPFLEKSFEVTIKLLRYPQEDIRKAAIDGLTQFSISFSKINSEEGKQATLKALNIFIPKLSEIIRLDEEKSVVISGLDAYSEILRELGSVALLGNGHKEAIMNCVNDVMKGKTECQDGEEPDEDDMEAEQDTLLVECAGEVFSSFGKASNPEEFAVYFHTVFPMLVSRMKKNKTEAQRSFAVGTISECFQGLKLAVQPYVNQILPAFIKLVDDQNPEVRNNAIYGIGELVFHGKDLIYPHYRDILQTLSSATSRESHPGARDNIVGAIARLILTNYNLLPMEQVFPVFISQLPLKEDFEETKSVLESIHLLYRDGHSVIMDHLQTVLKVAIDVIANKNVEDQDTREMAKEFIKLIQRDFPNEWNAVCATLPVEMQQALA